MARIRMVKPELFDDPDLGELTFAARWLFVGLLTQADRRGRLVNDPRRLKVRLMPFDALDVSTLLDELVRARIVIRYTGTDDKDYLQIRTFEKHQRPHPKEPESVIPPPAKKHGEPCKNAANPSESGFLILDSGTRNLEHAEDGKPASADADFEAFWAAYPRHVGKSKARHAWKRKAPNLAVCLDALDWQKMMPGWTKDGGVYIPHPLTWLNQERWNDEPPNPADRAAERLPDTEDFWQRACRSLNHTPACATPEDCMARQLRRKVSA